MPINQLYDTWKMRIMELRPVQRITQIRAFTWLIIGIYLSRSVCMSRVAGKIPGEAKLTSATRRLSRLLDNPAIRVRAWYEPIAREWLEAQFRMLAGCGLKKCSATLKNMALTWKVQCSVIFYACPA